MTINSESPRNYINSSKQDEPLFQDPLTKAEGRRQYEPQWYGLQSAFSEIERLHHSVTSAGNPIKMDLKTRYEINGIGKEQTIESVVQIHTDSSGKIKMVEDRWNDHIPDGVFATVSYLLDLCEKNWRTI